MAHKKDDGHPESVKDETHANVDDEFDDTETSEVAAQDADSASNDRDGAKLSDALELPDLDPVSVGSRDNRLFEPGDILAHRYQIVSLVHSGGMGDIYKAIDSRRHSDGATQAHVAIKTIRRSVAAEMDASLAIGREAATAQRLSHPNIINVYDFNEQDGLYFLIMEWLEGESLLDLLKRTRGRQVAPDFARQVIRGIASALEHAHSNDVVHADINPSNVFISDTQEVKLLDFGVARYGGGKLSATGDDSVWATRHYASPEVLSGLRPVIADDIFSLGCVAYRLLSGVHPFGGATASEAEEKGMPIRRIPELSDTEWQTLAAALSYSRSERPADISGFLHDEPKEDRPARQTTTRSWRVMVPAIGLAAVVAAAGTWWFAQGGLRLGSDTTTDGAEAGSVTSATDTLLERARVAMDENRLVSPQDNNARSYLRTVLTLDPGNVGALNGLREISDTYIEQANLALSADAPASASDALEVAEETDPSNPAIAIVNELLRARGDRLLADALMAATTGDEVRAAQLLFDAERYPHSDPERINIVRDQITESVLERQFTERLAQAETHMAASRLTLPGGNNAYETLVALVPQYGSDPRLQATIQRLGERLLSRAAFATTGGDFTEAGRLLDVAASLGVLAPEIATARASLQIAVEDVEAEPESAVSDATTEVADDETLTGLAAGALVSLPAAYEGTTAVTAEPVSSSDVSTSDLGLLPDAGAALAGLASAEVPESGMKVGDEPEKAEFVTLEDLGIQEYVPPRFPPRAERLAQNGFVEVRFQINTDGSTGDIEILSSEPGTLFDSSARRAVEQWRFPTRDEAMTTQLRLAFELATP